MKDRALEKRFRLWHELLDFGAAIEWVGLKRRFGKDALKMLHKRRERSRRESLDSYIRMAKRLARFSK